VGYLRAVFAEDNFEAVFAALDVEVPILWYGALNWKMRAVIGMGVCVW
jgi:hypothetical protein